MFDRKLITVALAATIMICTPAFAGDAGLAPGKPAGIRRAQFDMDTRALVATTAVAAGLIAVAVVVASQGNNGLPAAAGQTTPTTSSTTTTG